MGNAGTCCSSGGGLYVEWPISAVCDLIEFKHPYANDLLKCIYVPMAGKGRPRAPKSTPKAWRIEMQTKLPKLISDSRCCGTGASNDPVPCLVALCFYVPVQLVSVSIARRRCRLAL